MFAHSKNNCEQSVKRKKYEQEKSKNQNQIEFFLVRERE